MMGGTGNSLPVPEGQEAIQKILPVFPYSAKNLSIFSLIFLVL